MSYDVVVWAGQGPEDDDAAAEEYERRAEQAEKDAEDPVPATPAVRSFLADLVSRYPALGTAGDERSPWAMGPDVGDANGDFVQITMTYGGAEEAVSFVAETARLHGLVCFDPQSGRVL
jgi:hypothetical protein